MGVLSGWSCRLIPECGGLPPFDPLTDEDEAPIEKWSRGSQIAVMWLSLSPHLPCGTFLPCGEVYAAYAGIAERAQFLVPPRT